MLRLIRRHPDSAPDRPGVRCAPVPAVAPDAAGPDATRLTAVGSETRRGR